MWKRGDLFWEGDERWDEFRELGKLKGRMTTLVEKTLSSAAYGTQTYRTFDMPGVVHLDLLQYVKKEYKFAENSVSLKTALPHLTSDMLEPDQQCILTTIRSWPGMTFNLMHKELSHLPRGYLARVLLELLREYLVYLTPVLVHDLTDRVMMPDAGFVTIDDLIDEIRCVSWRTAQHAHLIVRGANLLDLPYADVQMYFSAVEFRKSGAAGGDQGGLEPAGDVCKISWRRRRQDADRAVLRARYGVAAEDMSEAGHAACYHGDGGSLQRAG